MRTQQIKPFHDDLFIRVKNQRIEEKNALLSMQSQHSLRALVIKIETVCSEHGVFWNATCFITEARKWDTLSMKPHGTRHR